jgi:hypothetical protein
VYAALAQARPADGQGIGILIDAEHLDTLLQECRCVSAIAQGCINRPPGARRRLEHRRQQDGHMKG